MKDTKLAPAAVFLSLLIGSGLFYLLRFLENISGRGLLLNALLEESGKLGLFILFWLASKKFDRFAKKKLLQGSSLFLYPLLSVLGFGLIENTYYFFSFPLSSIYFRLLYSYPIHLNTGLAYTLGFYAKKRFIMVLLFTASVTYHYALNVISLTCGTGLFIYGIGFANLLLFFVLVWKLIDEINLRRFLHARD